MRARSYELKLGYPSSHTVALDAAMAGGEVLNVGCGKADVTPALAARGCRVTDLACQPHHAAEFPDDVSRFDQIYLLGLVEHLSEPERFMEELRFAARRHRPEVVITTANVGFFVTRLMMLCGHFNYGRRGILDRSHRRLFTFRTLSTLLIQSGYRIIETRGVPAPFPLAVKTGWLARALLRVNTALLRLFRGLFSYQIFIRAQALPSVQHLLAHTIESSDALRGQYTAVQAD